ncbi:UNVERIFIED_CONTAM: hypothetical protein GTU68_043443 [Idotea baltica]|nr:hypothetical protein [Idotea baltica]
MSLIPSKIIGLDIGSSTVTAVAADIGLSEDGEQIVSITGVGSSPSNGLRKGIIINIDSTVSAIKDAVSQANSMSGSEIRDVVVNISGKHIKSLDSNGVVEITNNEVSSNDIEKVISVAKAVPIPNDRELLHVIAQDFLIDGQEGIKEPLGISGVRLESKIHLITGSVSCARNIVKCANLSGLNVLNLVFSPLASAEAVLTEDEKELGVCLVDFGGGTCDISVYHSGTIKHTSVIPVGGNHITNDIASGLQIPILLAERIKIEFDSEIDRKIEFTSNGDSEARFVSNDFLRKIIFARLEEIFSLIQKELDEAEIQNYITGGVVLTGGASNLSACTNIAQSVLNLPIRKAIPRKHLGLNDLIKYPEYSSACGLIHYALNSSNQSAYLNDKSKFKNFFKRAGSWFSEHF